MTLPLVPRSGVSARWDGQQSSQLGNPVASEVFAEAVRPLGVCSVRLDAQWPSEGDGARMLSLHSWCILSPHFDASASKGICGYDPGIRARSLTGRVQCLRSVGTVTFTDALRAVRLRGKLMSEAGKDRPAQWRRFLGLTSGMSEKCEKVSRGVCVPANFEFSWSDRGWQKGGLVWVREGIVLAKEAGAKRAVKLNVSRSISFPTRWSQLRGAEEILR